MPIICRARMTIVSICLLAATQSSAQEWTRFRGPNGSGVGQALTLPAEWTAGDENWRVKLPGIGHSSPVVWGKRIFLTAAQEDPAENTASRIVMCLNATDGSRLWMREYATAIPRRHKYNSLASSTPALDNQNAYVCWVTTDRLVATALDHAGGERWQADLGEFVASHGYGMSPILYRDLVIIANDQQGDSSLIALEKLTGRVRWRISRDTKVSYSTPCIHKRKDGTDEIIFTNWRHGISAIDPATGQTNWELSVFQQETLETVISSPFTAGDLIFGTCGYLGRGNHTVGIRLDETTPPQPVEVVRFDRGAPLTTTPLVYGNCLYLWSDGGIVTCANISNGEVHWRKRVGGSYFGSPVGVAGHVYCLSAEGEAVVLAASPNYRLIARNLLGEGSHSTPAIVDETMYVRTFSNLISIGGGNK